MRIVLLLLVTAAAQDQKPRPATSKLPSPANALGRDTPCSRKCPTDSVCRKEVCEVCTKLTCEDKYCPQGTICNEKPDGPDCVPDVPSCEDFFCPRGTNCYVRDGSPKCLPNTCEVRRCSFGLTCIDTPSGALCRRGSKRQGCAGKYCPENSKCIDTQPEGPHCVKI